MELRLERENAAGATWAYSTAARALQEGHYSVGHLSMSTACSERHFVCFVVGFWPPRWRVSVTLEANPFACAAQRASQAAGAAAPPVLTDALQV